MTRTHDEPERAPGATPAAPEVAAASPTQLVQQLQRTAGNHAVTRLLQRDDDPAAQAPPQPDFAALATGGDARAIGRLQSFEGATEEQRVQLLEALAAVRRPSRAQLAAMREIWEGMPGGGMAHIRYQRLYRACARAGARLPRWMPIDEWTLLFEIRAGVLTQHQFGRIQPALERLSLDDYLSFRSLYEGADTNTHRAFLAKALAARRTIREITDFWWDIWLRDEGWLLSNLMVTDEQVGVGSTGTGIAQQWQMSCGPTTVQTLHAQNDPLYALSLHEGGSISAQTQANVPLTTQQATILQGHGSTPTPIGTAGTGAWVERDLNALRRRTGVTYSFRAVTAVAAGNPTGGAVDRAWTAITGFLDQGYVVPLVIGGSPGNTAHYVMALRRLGDDMQVHDPALAQTVWVSKAQFLGNNMAPPLSWSMLAGYDRPSVSR
jgi:hypothetical protein